MLELALESAVELEELGVEAEPEEEAVEELPDVAAAPTPEGVFPEDVPMLELLDALDEDALELDSAEEDATELDTKELEGREELEADLEAEELPAAPATPEPPPAHDGEGKLGASTLYEAAAEENPSCRPPKTSVSELILEQSEVIAFTISETIAPAGPVRSLRSLLTIAPAPTAWKSLALAVIALRRLITALPKLLTDETSISLSSTEPA